MLIKGKKQCTPFYHFINPVLCVPPGGIVQRLIFRLYLPLKKHTTCLFCNKALNVSSLDWSQG